MLKNCSCIVVKKARLTKRTKCASSSIPAQIFLFNKKLIHETVAPIRETVSCDTNWKNAVHCERRNHKIMPDAKCTRMEFQLQNYLRWPTKTTDRQVLFSFVKLAQNFFVFSRTISCA